MDLRFTMLGLLSWKPSSGYDLKRIIADSDIFYWSGNNNQIYKTLIELQREDLVTFQIQTQESLPSKKIYSITEKGLSELRQGLLVPPEVPELRKDFLIQLAWAELLSDEEILALLKRYEEEIAARLKMAMFQAAGPASAPTRSNRGKYFWKRITENMIASYQTELDWVQQTQQELQAKTY